jgi:hypothetical protein
VVRVPGYISRGPGFVSRHCKILREVVGLERDPFSLVSTNEELLGRNNSGSGVIFVKQNYVMTITCG